MLSIDFDAAIRPPQSNDTLDSQSWLSQQMFQDGMGICDSPPRNVDSNPNPFLGSTISCILCCRISRSGSYSMTSTDFRSLALNFPGQRSAPTGAIRIFVSAERSLPPSATLKLDGLWSD